MKTQDKISRQQLHDKMGKLVEALQAAMKKTDRMKLIPESELEEHVLVLETAAAGCEDTALSIADFLK